MSSSAALHLGGCHCRRVRLEVELPRDIDIIDCNCSMCARSGFLHIIVPRSALRLLSGADELSAYSFGTGMAQHMFCAACGAKPFYVPRSHPDSYSLNLNCLDEPRRFDRITITKMDGRSNWEAEAARVRGDD